LGQAPDMKQAFIAGVVVQQCFHIEARFAL
jgi:hypothetical protein